MLAHCKIHFLQLKGYTLLWIDYLLYYLVEKVSKSFRISLIFVGFSLILHTEIIPLLNCSVYALSHCSSNFFNKLFNTYHMIFNIVTVFFFLHLIGQTFTGFCRWRHIWMVWEHNWTCRPITGGCRCPFWPVIKWVRACGAQSSQTPRQGGPVNDLWGGYRVTRSLRGQWASSWCWGGIGWACLLPKFGKFCLLLFY